MAEEKTDKVRLTVTLSTKTKNGTEVSISVVCGTWKMMQSFLSDFENTLLKGNNG